MTVIHVGMPRFGKKHSMPLPRQAPSETIETPTQAADTLRALASNLPDIFADKKQRSVVGVRLILPRTDFKTLYANRMSDGTIFGYTRIEENGKAIGHTLLLPDDPNDMPVYSSPDFDSITKYERNRRLSTTIGHVVQALENLHGDDSDSVQKVQPGTVLPTMPYDLGERVYRDLVTAIDSSQSQAPYALSA